MPWIPPIKDPSGRHRIWFRIPRAIPDSLDDLKGPDRGRIVLPISVDWGPPVKGGLDVANDAQLERAYSQIIANGNEQCQITYLNKKLLIEHWPRLAIEKWRVLPAWEKAFPILREKRILSWYH